MRAKINIKNLSEIEKGYLCGFYVGDGNIFIYPKQWIYRVRFHTFVNETQIQQKLILILGKICNNTKSYKAKNNTIVIETHAKDLIKFFDDIVTKSGIKTTNKTSRNFNLGFIEGMVDSDGYVQRNYAEITTMNPKLKNNLVSLLKMLKIEHNLRTFKSHLSKNTGYRIGFSLNCKLFYPIKWISKSRQTAE